MDFGTPIVFMPKTRWFGSACSRHSGGYRYGCCPSGYRTVIGATSLIVGPALMSVGDLFHPAETHAAVDQVAIVAQSASRWYTVGARAGSARVLRGHGGGRDVARVRGRSISLARARFRVRGEPDSGRDHPGGGPAQPDRKHSHSGCRYCICTDATQGIVAPRVANAKERRLWPISMTAYPVVRPECWGRA
jgi:hypothetical protein